MLMNSSKLAFPISSCLNSVTIFALSTLFCLTIVSCSSEVGQKIYKDHCGSIVPEASPSSPEVTTIPFLPNQDGYYIGGDELSTHQNSSQYFYSSSNHKTFLLRTEHVHSTDVDDIYKVEAKLIFENQGYVTYYIGDVGYSEPQAGAHDFELQGFWSTSSGKLCMVGSAFATSSQGQKPQSSAAILKLSDVKSSSVITSLIRGTLESLSSADDSNYFKPISLLIFPSAGYKYTMVSKDFNYGCPGEVAVPKNLSLSLTLNNPICSVVRSSYNSFTLEYKSGCRSSKSCNPFGEGLGYLPQLMSLRLIQCSEDKQSVRFLVVFHKSTYIDYYQSFDPNSTLVAEGSWDANKNQLCVVACRMSDSANSFDSSLISDCSTRLSLRFPATWSVESTSAIVGHIWTNKKTNVSGYFDRITFTSSRRDSYILPGLKYNYSLVERAAQECQMKKPNRKKGMQYPEGNGYAMQFSMSIKNSKGKGYWWGDSFPVFVGDQPGSSNSMGMSISRVANSAEEAETVPSKPVNISYKMSFSYYNENSTITNKMTITAEGTYDPATGSLCMVGCKYREPDLQALAKESMDCEILVKLQFPPINSNKHIQCRIESKRENSSSPLYFEPLSFSAVPYYSYGESIWRMDFEIIMVLITNTLACIFVGYQIFYLKKHHNVIPSISLVMLVTLTLGQMIPLMLNFEALFSSKQNHGRYARVEVNEVFVRVITLVAFLLHFRLLQLAFLARVSSENQKISWTAEKKTLYVSLSLYIAGGLIGFLVNRTKYGFGEEVYSRRRFFSNHRSLWQDSRSYSGLILDGFLFPQILLNIFLNSRGKVLSDIFYLGTTLVRLLPHAYDLYRARHSVDDYRWSYMYASPGADFYSTAWDVIIPLVGMLFASVIFLQQRFGSRCFLPKRFKDMGEYEKVPMTSDA